MKIDIIDVVFLAIFPAELRETILKKLLIDWKINHVKSWKTWELSPIRRRGQFWFNYYYDFVMTDNYNH